MAGCRCRICGALPQRVEPFLFTHSASSGGGRNGLSARASQGRTETSSLLRTASASSVRPKVGTGLTSDIVEIACGRFEHPRRWHYLAVACFHGLESPTERYCWARMLNPVDDVKTSELVSNDLELVIEAARLSSAERRKLVAIVSGAVPGNRDRPLFLLARAIEQLLDEDRIPRRPGVLFNLLASNPGKGLASRLDLALLNFLASMDDYRYFEAIASAMDRLAASSLGLEAIKGCTSNLASCLHKYRAQHLSTQRHRQKFADIAQFLASRPSEEPEDADALEFWRREATSTRWTLFETVLQALVSYSLASEVIRATKGSFSLDAEGPFDGVSGSADFALGSLVEMLNIAIDAMDQPHLKIFKNKELSLLRRIATLGRFAATWPRSTFTLCALAPYQASIVQNSATRQRRGTTGRNSKMRRPG